MRAAIGRPYDIIVRLLDKLKFEPQYRTGCAQWRIDYFRPVKLVIACGGIPALKFEISL